MKYILAISTILLLGCNNSKDKDINSEEFYNTTDLSKKENIIYKTFSLDTLKISDIETSYVGQFSIFKDTIYFTDERFAYVFLFDKEGKFIAQNIGKGTGPNEIIGLSGSVLSQNNFISYIKPV